MCEAKNKKCLLQAGGITAGIGWTMFIIGFITAAFSTARGPAESIADVLFFIGLITGVTGSIIMCTSCCTDKVDTQVAGDGLVVAQAVSASTGAPVQAQAQPVMAQAQPVIATAEAR